MIGEENWFLSYVEKNNEKNPDKNSSNSTYGISLQYR